MSRIALIDSDEKFLSITDHEGLYLISNFGKIYSEPRTEFVNSSRTGGHYRYRNACWVLPRTSKEGYLQVGLYKEGKCKRVTLHRLVAQHFIPNPNDLPEVNHKDGCKTNNHYENLEWVTRSINSLHSTQVLGKNRGVSNTKSKLTEEEVLEIKKLLLLNASQTDISKLFNVTNHAIYRIQHGYSWAWLTGFDRKGGLYV